MLSATMTSLWRASQPVTRKTKLSATEANTEMSIDNFRKDDFIDETDSLPAGRRLTAGDLHTPGDLMAHQDGLARENRR